MTRLLLRAFVLLSALLLLGFPTTAAFAQNDIALPDELSISTATGEEVVELILGSGDTDIISQPMCVVRHDPNPPHFATGVFCDGVELVDLQLSP